MNKSLLKLTVLNFLIVAPYIYAQEPPPEAFKACEGKNAGIRSEFTDPKGELLKGTCENDGQGKLVLRPDRGENNVVQQHHTPPPEAYAACTGKKIGDQSKFVSPRGETIIGTCADENAKLVLRPDQNKAR